MAPGWLREIRYIKCGASKTDHDKADHDLVMSLFVGELAGALGTCEEPVALGPGLDELGVELRVPGVDELGTFGMAMERMSGGGSPSTGSPAGSVRS